MKEQNYKIISTDDAAKMCGISRGSIINLEKLGIFPQRVNLTAKRFAYKLSEIETWLNDKIADRDIAAAATGGVK